jgi:lipid II:glycine glycyltransferase (peptidoglycan interpeptide bridge formation enzyme)
MEMDELWMDFEHKVRKNVNKARRSGVTVVVDPAGERLDDFLRIYNETMDRREAGGGYYFGRGFFERIGADLPGQHCYLHALHEGEVISTELVLVSEENVYSFLGGTDSRFFALRPNDLLKHEIIAWAKAQGKRRFVLGGGYEPDDGIYRYKLAFAPHGAVPFFAGTRVLRPDAYEALVRARAAAEPGWQPRPGFFPAYRA